MNKHKVCRVFAEYLLSVYKLSFVYKTLLKNITFEGPFVLNQYLFTTKLK